MIRFFSIDNGAVFTGRRCYGFFFITIPRQDAYILEAPQCSLEQIITHSTGEEVDIVRRIFF
ncbi:hypothetical protein SPFM10_00217 [Salmonella phage SPFM10]|nr:hypothetical protein SPFM10_00217 [Salmonella phage SPFM10]